MATIRHFSILHSDRCLDCGPGIVALEGEIFVTEIEEALHLRIQYHTGQGARLAGELLRHLLEVVEVDMGVARGVDEFPGFQLSCE